MFCQPKECRAVTAKEMLDAQMSAVKKLGIIYNSSQPYEGEEMSAFGELLSAIDAELAKHKKTGAEGHYDHLDYHAATDLLRGVIDRSISVKYGECLRREKKWDT